MKSDIGRWLRQTIASHSEACTENYPSQTKGITTPGTGTDTKPSTIITIEQFYGVRLVLEDIEDFAILADVLKIVCVSTDDNILTAITDTTNHHFDTMAAIGATDDLFQALLQQYTKVQGRNCAEKSFVESLIDLGDRLPNAAQEVRSLRKDLSLYEQTISAAACSPISDHMAEALQSAESTFSDEIDQLLTSGNSMDKQVLSQVFQTIIKRLELSWHVIQPPINFAELLIRLRSFGPNTFDLLIADWLQDMLCSTCRPSLSNILPPLVCNNSITLDLVLARSVALLEGTQPPGKFFQVALDVLDLLTIDELEYPPPMVYRQYRFRIQQQQVMQNSASSVIPLLRAAIVACVGEEVSCTNARNLITSPRTRTLIQVLLTQHKETFSQISSAFILGLSVEQVQMAIDGIVYASDPQPSSLLNFDYQISKVSETVSDFNLPLCQLRLRTAFGTSTRSSNNPAATLMATFIKASESSDDEYLLCWPMLVSRLAADQALQVREEAENELVLDVHKETHLDLAHRRRVTEAVASIVEATAFSITDAGSPLVVAQVADRLTSLLSSPQLSTDQPSISGLTLNEAGQILEHNYISLEILLRLLIIHQSTIHHQKFSQNTLARLLITLSILLVNPILSSHPTLPSYIFDTLTCLTDLQTEETRSHCIRILRDQQRTKDPRLLFLFGYSESTENEWLQLVANPISKALDPRATGAALGSAATIATPTTQPFPLRRWEMMQDATPLVTENDTSLSLTLFGARKAIL